MDSQYSQFRYFSTQQSQFSSKTSEIHTGEASNKKIVVRGSRFNIEEHRPWLNILMHNMIVEDERNESLPLNYDAREGKGGELTASRDHTTEFQDFIQNQLCIRNRGTYSQLQANLVEHLLHFPRGGGGWCSCDLLYDIMYCHFTLFVVYTSIVLEFKMCKNEF